MIIALLAALSLVAAACGDDDATAASDSATAANEGSGSSSEVAEDNASADEADDGATSDGAGSDEDAATEAGLCADGQREYTHPALGTVDSVCIPEDPQRIAVFDPNMTSFMIQIGAEPVAHLDIWLTSLVQSHPGLADEVDAWTANSTSVGPAPGEFNLEALAAADPDIVLTADHYITEVRDQIEAIAPVVAFDYFTNPAADWSGILEIYADAANLDAELAESLTGIEQRIDVLASELEDQEGETVSIVTNYTGDFQVLLSEWPVSLILERVGLARPDSQGPEAEEAAGNGYNAPLSLERLDEIDADHLLVVQFSPEAAEGIEELQAMDLYQSLDVVAAGEDHVVGGHFVTGGIYDIHKTIDELFLYVADVDPADVSPNPLPTG